MKLLGSPESKTNKDKNGNNVRHLEITEAILIYYNIVSNDYDHIEESCMLLFLINLFFIYLMFLQNLLYF